MVFCATGFGKKKEFCCGEEPIRVRLNSKKLEDGSAVFTFYEEPVAETLCLPWWLQCVLMSINGKMKRMSGFGIIIAKTREACVIAKN